MQKRSGGKAEAEAEAEAILATLHHPLALGRAGAGACEERATHAKLKGTEISFRPPFLHVGLSR